VEILKYNKVGKRDPMIREILSQEKDQKVEQTLKIITPHC